VEFYVAVVLALTLAPVAAVLYFYVMFLEARGRQQKKRVAELERANADLLAELRQMKSVLDGELEHNRQLWPEVLDEGGNFSRN
jgi:hypothetical protein